MHVMQSPPGPQTVIDGTRYLYFAGTSYYCLHGHPDVILAACRATCLYGIGSATSRSGFGNNPPLLEVEQRAAEFFGDEQAFYYVSGYCGNAVMAQGLQQEYDIFFIDKGAHFSVFEGVNQTGKHFVIFEHLSPESLDEKLKENLRPSQRPLLISDGVFPISGAIPPLKDYLEVLSKYDGAGVCLDDAHAAGVLGRNGRGTLEYLELGGDNLYFSGTLSKAFGGHGGIITGSKEFIDDIKRKTHLYIGSSPPPVPAAAATAKALEILSAHPEMRTRLWENVAKLKRGLQKLGIEVDDTPVPIICIEIGDSAAMQAIQQRLSKQGIIIAYTREYAGVGKEGALRIAVFSEHTGGMLDKLLSELEKIL